MGSAYCFRFYVSLLQLVVDRDNILDEKDKHNDAFIDKAKYKRDDDCGKHTADQRDDKVTDDVKEAEFICDHLDHADHVAKGRCKQRGDDRCNAEESEEDLHHGFKIKILEIEIIVNMLKSFVGEFTIVFCGEYLQTEKNGCDNGDDDGEDGDERG